MLNLSLVIIAVRESPYLPKSKLNQYITLANCDLNVLSSIPNSHLIH